MVSAIPRVVPFAPVTIEMFLKAVFGSRWREALAAYFLGDPQRSPNWSAYPAGSVLRAMTPLTNNYWDPSLPCRGGGRTGADFEAIYAIVIDDYGVKVDEVRVRDLLGCDPSYIIETSPGNFHAGWFIEPQSDRAWVWGLLRALYRALGNTGDNLVKPTTWVRLPVGTNGKLSLGLGPTGFQVKLVHWRPDIRITYTDWIDIETRIGAIIPVDPRLDLDTAMPDPAEIEADVVLKVLRSRGMVLDQGHSMTFGWGFEVECPWAGDHSDPRTSAAYVPVKERFKCHHGHCQDRTMGALREWADQVIREDSGGLESLASQEFDDIELARVPAEVAIKQAGGAALASYEATEDGLAQAFADHHRDQLRFDHIRGRWFCWTGDFWRQDEIQHAFRWARDLVRAFRRSMQDAGPGQLRAFGKMAVPAAIEKAARADQWLATDGLFWDRDPWLAGAPGCEIDLRTGEVNFPDPAHGITKQLLVAPQDMPIPIWGQFLRDSTGGDTEMITFLQAWSGYCLTGDVSEEKFVFFYGPGGNGKGTFLFTISAILNDYAARTPADTFMVRKHDAHPTEIARLAGARMVTAAEIEEGRIFNAGRLKDFTGRDGKLMGRFMRQDWFQFAPQFKIVFVGNNQPRLTNVDDAMRRRTVLIPFTQIPAIADITLKDRLVPEYPGILHWMIEGENRRRTMGGLAALIPRAATEATSEYLDNQDTLKIWDTERCVFGPAEQVLVTKAYEDYRTWCHNQGSSPEIVLREFSRKFTVAHTKCRVDHTMQGNMLMGVSLKPQDVC